MDGRPTILWLRRDLRLGDNPALAAALTGGGPVVPVFVLDPWVEAWGTAPRWRLGLSLADLARRLGERGSRLVLRRGPAAEILLGLAAATGAECVVWSRVYDPDGRARDAAVETALEAAGVRVATVNTSLLFEPWTVETGSGGPYRVFTPFWRAVKDRDVEAPIPEPSAIPVPAEWPASDDLAGWRLGAGMNRGAAVVARFAVVGEAAARSRLDGFLADRAGTYATSRDVPASGGTSGLAENLTWGEIGPRTVWHAARALSGTGGGAEAFLRELVWREFSYHLLWHTPALERSNWRGEWDAFPWRDDNADAEAWRRGMTGFEMVDAAMRELYVTGRMHNRMRMLTASVLTKHFLTDWRVGDAWFRDCLIDWDVAANAMGWQWVAGSGPDAAPYFRVFNPVTQAQKFDPEGAYRDRFLAEGRRRPHRDALAFFEAVPRSWGLSPDAPYPAPVVDHAEGRARALEAYSRRAASA